MLRKIAVPLCLAAFVNACSCDEPVKPELGVTITAPKDGASLTMKDDVDAATAGLQVAVRATTKGFAASDKATLALDGVAVGEAVALTYGAAEFAKVTLAAGSHVLKVVATGKDGSAEAVLSVVADDTVVPCTLSMASPGDGAVLNASADLDAAAAGMQAGLTAKSSGCEGGVIRFCATGAGLGGAACKKAGGQVIGEVALSETNLTALLATLPEGALELAAEHDAGGEVVAAAKIRVTVDSIAPTVSFVAPQEGETLTDQTVELRLAIVGAEPEQNLVVESSALSAPISPATLPVGNGTVVLAVNLPAEEQTLTARVADKAGNKATRSIKVKINLEGCDVVPLDPSSALFAFNAQNAAAAGSPALGKYTVKGKSVRCPDGEAKFSKTVGGAKTDLGTAALVNGEFTKEIALADGEADATLTIKIDKAGMKPNSGVAITYLADFTPPVLVSAVPATGDLFVVHASSTNLGKPGYLADADAAAGGGQVDMVLTVRGAGSISSTMNFQGSVVVTAAGTELHRAGSKDNAQRTETGRITVAEGYEGAVDILLADAAGNTASASWNARIATSALPAPVLTAPVAGTINVTQDAGGDRATFAVVPAAVSFGAAVPAGAQVVLCSSVSPGAGAPACASSGYFEIPQTRTAASGTSHSWAAVKLPQGAQDLRAELTEALGGMVSSAPVHVVVDTVPPAALTLKLSADANDDALLSGGELDAAEPVVVAATFQGVEDNQVATLFDGATSVGTATVTGNAASFSLAALEEGSHALRVEVGDAAGNPNLSTTLTPPIENAAAARTFTIQRVAPSIAVTAPTFTLCNLPNGKPSSDSTFCDLDLTVQVGATATRVEFALDPATAGTVTPASTTTITSGLATAAYRLAQSGTPVKLVATVFDAANNARTAEHAIQVVDTVRPQVTIVKPLDGATVYSQILEFEATTDAEAGQTLTVTSSVGGQVGSGPVQAGVPNFASFNLNITGVSQTLTASVTDANGNPSLPATAAVTMSLAGCDVVLADPASATFAFNLDNTTASTTPGSRKYTVRAQSTRCPDGLATLTKTVGGTATDLGTAQLAGGSFTKEIQLADGEASAVLTIKVDKTGVPANSGVSIDYMADFTPPTLVEAIPATGNLFVVHPSSPKLGTAGFVADADAAAADGQLDVNLTASGVGSISPALGLSGKISVSVAGTELFASTYTDNGQQTLGQRISLAEGYVGPVDILLQDAAGNRTTAKWDARVSTLPLPTLAITTPAAGTINVTKDIGGDRLTYAVVQGVVTYKVGTTAQPAPAGSQIALCSTVNYGGTSPACGTQNYFELPNTRQAATSTSQFYSGLRLPQGTQDILAEMTSAVGEIVASAAVHLTVDTRPPRVLSVRISEDGNNDGFLTGGEVAAGLSVNVAATFEGVEDNRTATLYSGTTVLKTAAVVGNAATFTTLTLLDGSHTLRVAVSDAAGNPSESTTVSPPITNAEATRSFTVQRVAPTISFTAPAFDTCNLTTGKATSTDTYCDLDATVLLGSTATRVDFSLSPASAGTVSPASASGPFTNSRATTAIRLYQSTTPVTLVATVYDLADNSRQATHTLQQVDTVRPNLTITKPLEGETVFAQTFQFEATTDAEVGQPMTVRSLANNQVVGTGLVQAGSPNFGRFNVSVPSGSQTLTATVTDKANNASDPKAVNILMNLQGCDVNFTTPASASPLFNASNAPGGTVHIAGYSSRGGCAGQQIEFTAAVNGGAPGYVTTVTTDSNGNFEFDHTFGDSTVTVFTGKSLVTGSSENFFTAITDITPPTIDVVTSPNPAHAAALYVVAKTGNVNVKAGLPNYLPDLDDTTAGGQVAFAFSATGAGPSANTGVGKIQILQGTEVLYEATNADNLLRDIARTVSVDQAFVGTIELVASDAAGNVATKDWATVIDVIAPEQPSFVTTDPGTGEFTRVIQRREASFRFLFSVPHDDGVADQTLVWETGYTTDTRLAGASFDTSAFENGSITSYPPPPPAGAEASTNVQDVGPLAPFDRVSFGARIRDAVGNRSAIAITALAPYADFDLLYPGSASGASFGYSLAVGDIDADGKSDLAVAAPFANSNTGEVYIYSGGIPSFGAPKSTIIGQKLNSRLGSFLALGDVTGDGHADLLANDSGEVLLFIAKPTGTDWTISAPPDFRFKASSTGFSSLAILPSINGDTADEVVLGDPAVSTLGQVAIFYGRADWSAVAAAGVIPESSANTIITGTDANGRLGAGRALRGIPDVDSDGTPELVVAAQVAKKVYLFSGATLLTAGATTTPLIAIGPFYSATGVSFGDSSGIADVNNDGLSDLIIGDKGQNAVFTYPQTAAHTFTIVPAQAPWTTGANNFGSSIVFGTFNTGNGLDLFVGPNTTSAGRVSGFFSPHPASAVTPGTVITGPGTFGNAIQILDVDADGNSDLAIGAPSGGTNGLVKIRY